MGGVVGGARECQGSRVTSGLERTEERSPVITIGLGYARSSSSFFVLARSQVLRANPESRVCMLHREKASVPRARCMTGMAIEARGAGALFYRENRPLTLRKLTLLIISLIVTFFVR